jgi:tetratricopeptide (TPR) repeat protein
MVRDWRLRRRAHQRGVQILHQLPHLRPVALTLALVAPITGACARSPKDAGAAAPGPPPTFTKDIAPILFANCAPCHRAGQAAPFTLLGYADAKQRVDKIVDATANRHMPPWLPEAGVNEFAGERRLTDAEIATIRRWAKEGAVEGDPADLPKAPVFAEGWQLGQPDLVATMPRAYTLAPKTGDERKDVFRNVVLQVALPSNRYVRAVEFRPGAAAVVHHAVISLDRTRTSRRRDGVDGQPGYDGMITQGAQTPDGHFLGWTPGRGPIVAPPGMPWRLERGADLVVQLHLIPANVPVHIQPIVGLYFADTPPAHAPVMVKLGSKAIDIAAGDRAYAIEDRYSLPVDVDVLSVYPHAHYLGKDMQALATLPDGSTRWLLRIRDWDFHWQQDYRYVTPIALPRGTTLTMRYTYDNSKDNEHNPSKPPRGVVYGPNSSDEMGDLWVQVLPKSPADASVLVKSFAERDALANVAGAEMAVRRAPNDAKNQAFLGSAYVQVGRAQEAIPHLEEALRLDPKSANAHNYLGGALLAIGKSAEAIAHLRQAAALDPQDERLPFNLGNALNVAGQPAEAANAFARALAINPDFAEAHENLGIYLASNGRLADALTHLRRAVALAPESADAESDLGGVLAMAGKRDEALSHIRRALELSPDHPAAKANLAALRSGKPGKQIP